VGRVGCCVAGGVPCGGKHIIIIGITPSGITPSDITPSGVTPSGITPSGITPSDIIPSGITPSGITPFGITPAGITPSDITPSGIGRFAREPVDGIRLSAASGGRHPVNELADLHRKREQIKVLPTTVLDAN